MAPHLPVREEYLQVNGVWRQCRVRGIKAVQGRRLCFNVILQVGLLSLWNLDREKRQFHKTSSDTSSNLCEGWNCLLTVAISTSMTVHGQPQIKKSTSAGPRDQKDRKTSPLESLYTFTYWASALTSTLCSSETWAFMGRKQNRESKEFAPKGLKSGTAGTQTQLEYLLGL